MLKCLLRHWPCHTHEYNKYRRQADPVESESRYPGFDPGCGIRENAKFIDGIRELTVTREAGFAKILAQEAEWGKKMVLGLEMTGVRHAGLS